MVIARDVEAQKLTEHAKEELKKIKEIQPPAWAMFAKSGTNRNRPPIQPDFWYIRAASVLRRIYVDGPVGTSKLRTFYGGRKIYGTKPPHFKKSGGNIIRKIFQQLEAAGMIEKASKGRKITKKGQKFLDNIAHQIKSQAKV